MYIHLYLGLIKFVSEFCHASSASENGKCYFKIPFIFSDMIFGLKFQRDRTINAQFTAARNFEYYLLFPHIS